MSQKSRRKKLFVVLIVILCLILIINWLYLLKMDTTYAIKFGEIIKYGSISEFDDFFSQETIISNVEDNKSIIYKDARVNVINYINSNESVDLGETYGNGPEYGGIVEKIYINNASMEEVYIVIVKKLFKVEVKEVVLKGNTEDLIKIFFGE